jgi:hypothetical protein
MVVIRLLVKPPLSSLYPFSGYPHLVANGKQIMYPDIVINSQRGKWEWGMVLCSRYIVHIYV